jgi:hypothetical protein
VSDNSTLNSGTGGDTYRSRDYSGSGPKTQVVAIDTNPGGAAEALMSAAAGMPVSPVGDSRQDTFTTTANGTAVDVSARPQKHFALQVTETGTVTSWSVVLEGSLDGTTYSTIMTHTKAANGSGGTIWNPSAVPCRFYRSRCSAIVLGGGTNVVARILGMN